MIFDRASERVTSKGIWNLKRQSLYNILGYEAWRTFRNWTQHYCYLLLLLPTTTIYNYYLQLVPTTTTTTATY